MRSDSMPERHIRISPKATLARATHVHGPSGPYRREPHDEIVQNTLEELTNFHDVMEKAGLTRTKRRCRR